MEERFQDRQGSGLIDHLLSSRGLFYGLLFIMVVYPLLFIWQGLDVTDTGFALTNYQEIFSDPHSIRLFGFIFWLTNVIGGLFLKILGQSVLSIRLATVIVMYATLFASYLTLKQFVSKNRALLGLFVAEIFIERWYWLNYNSLTALFFVVATFALVRGLAQPRSVWIYVAGFFVGANVFVRLPNVSGLMLILVIGLAGLIDHRSLRRTSRQAFEFVAGFAIALLVIFGVMNALGQWTLFTSSVQYIFSVSNDGQATHGFSNLIQLYLNQFLALIKELYHAGRSAVLGVLVLILTRYVFRRTMLPFYLVLVGVSVVWTHHYLHTNLSALYFILGLQYVVLLGVLFHPRMEKRVRVFALIGLIITQAACVGSDNGLVPNSKYGMYLSLPFVLAVLMQDPKLQALVQPSKIRPFAFYFKKSTPILGAILILFMSVFALKDAYSYTYRDTSQRLAMNTTFSIPKLKGIYTTKARAQAVTELLDHLHPYVKPKDRLLAYESIPLVYFLTDTRPYLSSPWPLIIKPQQLRQAMNLAQQTGPLPVVVRAKYSTSKYNWPDTKAHVVTKGAVFVQNQTLINVFIQKHGYQKAWENDFFQILVPPTGY